MPEEQQEMPPIDPVAEVRELLSEQLDEDNQVALRHQIAVAEAWQARVAFQYRNAQRLLAIMRKQYLLPKSREYTDMDREITLGASTADQATLVELLKDYQDILARRISVGQSMLKSNTQEMKAGLTAQSASGGRGGVSSTLPAGRKPAF